MSNRSASSDLSKVVEELARAAARLEEISDKLQRALHVPQTRTAHPSPIETSDTPIDAADAAATEDVSSGMSLTPSQRLICERIINVFETGSINGDYSNISIYRDGPGNRRQITYGRAQTTEYGNLKRLVQEYVDNDGMFADGLRSFVSKIGSTPLVDNQTFKNLLVAAGRRDPIMARTQDKFFDEVYFKPAQEWASRHGFTRALCMIVIYDSFVHSGSILGFLRERFPEPTPDRGGDEKVWVKQYVDVRHRWLATHSRPILRQTVYRMFDLGREIARGNWDLDNLPISANGVRVDARSGGAGEALAEGRSQVAPHDIPAIEDQDGDETYASRDLPADVDENTEANVWCESDDEGPEAAIRDSVSAHAVGDSPEAIAARILQSSRIFLANTHSSGRVDQATAKHNIVDTAEGRPARRSNYSGAPGGTVSLDRRMLRGMLTLSQEFGLSVSEICGGGHSRTSRHYAGLGFDVNYIDGEHVGSGHPKYRAFMRRCHELGATEVLGPGARGHSTHIHAAWPRR